MKKSYWILIIFVLGFIYTSCSYKTYKVNKLKSQQWADSARIEYKKGNSLFERIAARIKVNANDTIVDIGGGFGYHSSMIAKYLPSGITYFEEDVNQKWCNKKQFQKTFKFYNSTANIDNFRFFIGDSVKIPFSDNSFKTVTLFISIHEFQNRDLMMREINRILKDNGKLYIFEDVYKNTPEKDPFCKFSYLSTSELTDLVTKTGFTIIPNSDINKNDSSANIRGVFLECSKSINLMNNK